MCVCVPAARPHCAHSAVPRIESNRLGSARLGWLSFPLSPDEAKAEGTLLKHWVRKGSKRLQRQPRILSRQARQSTLDAHQPASLPSSLSARQSPISLRPRRACAPSAATCMPCHSRLTAHSRGEKDGWTMARRLDASGRQAANPPIPSMQRGGGAGKESVKKKNTFRACALGRDVTDTLRLVTILFPAPWTAPFPNGSPPTTSLSDDTPAR